jgi:hypothetical protein
MGHGGRIDIFSRTSRFLSSRSAMKRSSATTSSATRRIALLSALKPRAGSEVSLILHVLAYRRGVGWIHLRDN